RFGRVRTIWAETVRATQPAASHRHPAAEDPRDRAVRGLGGIRPQRERQRFAPAQSFYSGVPRRKGEAGRVSAAARWTRPSDLVAQVRKRWDRGELLSAMVSDEPVFPLRAGLRPPTSTDLTEHFEDVRAWVAELREMKHVRLQMREFRHRIRGASALP